MRSYYIQELEEQLADYEVDDKKLTQDFVVALYQAIWWLEKKLAVQKPKTFTINRAGGSINPYYANPKTNNLEKR